MWVSRMETEAVQNELPDTHNIYVALDMQTGNRIRIYNDSGVFLIHLETLQVRTIFYANESRKEENLTFIEKTDSYEKAINLVKNILNGISEGNPVFNL